MNVQLTKRATTLAFLVYNPALPCKIHSCSNVRQPEMLVKPGKIFCISFQRSGTTSVGKFFRDHGIRAAGWAEDFENLWSDAWFRRDYDTIFDSKPFKQAQGFEDSPWFFPKFYEMLFHRFPDSKFILLKRDPDSWFRSMMSHSRGNILGRTNIHCAIYDRQADYDALADRPDVDMETENNIHSEKTLKLAGFDAHYKRVYAQHYEDAELFFKNNAPDSLFSGDLGDPKKWTHLGEFLKLNVGSNYDAHENRTRKLP